MIYCNILDVVQDFDSLSGYIITVENENSIYHIVPLACVNACMHSGLSLLWYCWDKKNVS